MTVVWPPVSLAVIVLFGYSSAQLDPEEGRELLQLHRRSCSYAGLVYTEGQQVLISDEPCLNCSCHLGSLVCHLRVCPMLPDPPPPGCVLVHRNRQCCPQLICRDGGLSTQEDGRSDITLRKPDINTTKGCVLNGTVYGEGSAMHTSGLCDYCFCIKGRQQCVQPKCILPLEGCRPAFRSLSCCPTYYNCSEAIAGEITTTSIAPSNFVGCEINGLFYPEGEKVDTVAKSNCENCFCMKGKIQCVSLECAPPLLGCIPILTPGKCCPESYNCSGVNELDFAEDTNVGISKDNHLDFYTDPKSLRSTISKRKQVSSVRSLPASLMSKTHHQQQIISEGRSNHDSARGIENTTTPELNTTSTDAPTTSSDPTETTMQETSSDATSTEATTITTEVTTISSNQPTTSTIQTTLEVSSDIKNNDVQERFGHTEDISNDIPLTTIKADIGKQEKVEEELGEEEEEHMPMTVQTETTFITSLPTTMIIPQDMYIANITVVHSNITIVEKDDNITAVNGSLPPVRAIPPEIEAILNITHKKDDDYEYDYNESSLPPSLPNLRIIPFVAADAVPEDHDEVDRPTVYPTQDKLRPTDSPLYYKVSHPNRFSPPVETEGGFVPREPILDGPFYESKYEVPYHTTGLNIPDTHLAVDITSGTIIPPSNTMLPKPNDERCLSDGREYRHGELISEPSACVMCLCFYGEVLCQETKCPHVNTGCRRLKEKEHGLCCGRIICDDGESPTVVLDRIDITPSPLQTLQQPPPLILGGIVPPITVADGVVTPDPFRDVIRTEPAPDLPSLIEYMMPYLLERHSSTSSTTILKPSTQSTQLKTTSTTTMMTTPTTRTSTTTTAASTTTTITTTNTTTPQTSTTEGFQVSETSDLLSDINNEEDTLEVKIINDNDDIDELSKEEDDVISGLSFDSVLQYLFSGGETTQATRRPSTTTSRISDKPSEEPIKMTHNTVAVTSDNSSQTFRITENKQLLNITTEANKVSSIQENINLLSELNNTSTKYSSVPSSVLTTVLNSIGPTTSSREPPPGRPPNLDSVPMTTDLAGLGVLKLAGCNIYGRMYRVGRIISELSGPCLECMCTEVGVQCRPLDC